MAKILLKVPARANLSHNETQFPPEIKHISAQNQSERREDPTTATLSLFLLIPPPEVTGFKIILFSCFFHQLPVIQQITSSRDANNTIGIATEGTPATAEVSGSSQKSYSIRDACSSRVAATEEKSATIDIPGTSWNKQQ
jgi:hypothetical protein